MHGPYRGSYLFALGADVLYGYLGPSLLVQVLASPERWGSTSSCALVWSPSSGLGWCPLPYCSYTGHLPNIPDQTKKTILNLLLRTLN